MPLKILHAPVQLESGGVHWTVYLCLYIGFTCPSPVESTGLSLKRSPAFRVNCFATQSAGVQPDYVGERKVVVMSWRGPTRNKLSCKGME